MPLGIRPRSLRTQTHAVILVLALAAAGAAAAAMLSLHVLDNMAWRTVGHDAERLLNAAGSIRQEAREVLQAANASPAKPCTSDDLALLRRLAFESRAVKDVGRLQDGKLICSGTLGVLDTPYVYPDEPDLVVEGRYHIYAALDLLIAPGRSATIVNEGNANIVIDPRSLEAVTTPGIRTGAKLLDHANDRMVEAAGSDPAALAHGSVRTSGQSRQGDTLFATNCGLDGLLCVTASASGAELRGGSQVLLMLFSTLAGGAAGGSLGVALVALIRRARAFPRRLRNALAREHVQLLYQPIIDSAHGRTVGAEALLRLTLDGRPIPPDVVADAALRHGLSLGLLRAVMRAAARELGPLLRSRPHLRISFNVTAADLADPGLPDALRVMLDQCASPRQVMLELTERHAPDPAAAALAVERLRALGISVALDDFGMGHSNIASVTALRVEMVKLDRSFAEAVGTGSPREAVVPEIIALATKLNLSVVAEGVETELQGRFFAERGVPWHQGWLYGHPMTAAELAERLAHEAGLAHARAAARPA